MISNNGTDIFRYWGEARVSGSADSATCSPGMERLFAFPLLSVKRKPTWNTAGCGSMPKRGISPRNWGAEGMGTRMKSTGIHSPGALFTDARRARVVSPFFLFLSLSHRVPTLFSRKRGDVSPRSSRRDRNSRECRATMEFDGIIFVRSIDRSWIEAEVGRRRMSVEIGRGFEESAIENRIRTEEGTSARRITPEAGTRP